MEKYLSYITIIFAICGGIFSFLKYLDLRDREEKRLDYENFNKLIEKISGNVNSIVMIANIYQLIEFKRYSKIIIPLLKHLKGSSNTASKFVLNDVYEAIDYILLELK